MILLIDAGNTRVKWAWVTEKQWIQQDYVLVEQIDGLTKQWQRLPMPSQILGCCVAGEQVMRQLEMLALTCFTQPIAWLQVTAYACGVRNGYTNLSKSDRYTSTLGADRWAALIAAHYHYPGPCIVVNAGTAVTIDALTANGEFLGGMILPGMRLMQQALHHNTAQLPFTGGQYKDFPTTTADAIYTGIITALSSAIDKMVKRLSVHCPSSSIGCVISGGDAQLVSPYLNDAYQLVNELVLQGLHRLAQSGEAVWQLSEPFAEPYNKSAIK